MKLENRKNEHRFEEPYSWKTKIPKRWQLVPNRGLFTERNVKNCPDYQPLTVTIKSGVSRQADYLETSTKKDNSNENKDNYKLVRPGDLAYNKMRMWQGAVGVSNYEGIVSPAYIVIRPKVNLVSKFFHYLFRTKEYTVESYRHSYGISSDQLSLRFEDFKTILTPLPPLQEQQAIVRFLDQKLAKIDEYIRKKERMIELLKEQKTSLINEAVTQGLDPNVTMKDSNLDWINNIPKHWSIVKTIHYYDIRLGKMLQPEPIKESDFKVMYAKAIHVTWNSVHTDNLPEMWVSKEELTKYRIIDGDLLVCEGGEGGRASVVEKPPEDCIIQNALHRVRTKKNANLEFLKYILFALKASKKLELLSDKATIGHFTYQKFSNLKIPFPPKKEQDEIVNYIRAKTDKIDKISNSLSNQINKMKEYRQSLISEAVTGKIDCREHMPEQTANADV
jgi:type I restriction enzyme S subunit